jgi:1-acyl-sn-glycerol-3-phosphate acyltransferase
LFSWLKSLNNKFDGDECLIISQKIFLILEKLGFKFSIVGINNINKVSGPIVFIANHMSVLETLILPGIIQPHKDVTFIVKEELLKYPLFKSLLIARNVIPITRKNPKSDYEIIINKGSQLLQQNISVLIFPQSTRKVKFNPKEFKKIGIKLAQKNGVSVVSIALATDAWAIGKLIKDFGKFDINKVIQIEFNKPFSPDKHFNKGHQSVIDFITKKLAAWNKKEYLEVGIN